MRGEKGREERREGGGEERRGGRRRHARTEVVLELNKQVGDALKEFE